MPLLLGLGREDRALGAALESGDADLVYLALFRMQRSQPLQQFLAALAGRPQARALFSAYCAHTVLLRTQGPLGASAMDTLSPETPQSMERCLILLSCPDLGRAWGLWRMQPS